MAKRAAPEVNAGSMADIAFLLLIFFLVTTTIASDTGINRKLPPKLPIDTPAPPIKERNLFQVIVNKNNELLVENENMELKDLRQAAIDFLDNGAGKDRFKCDYCRGKKDENSSLNPDKAVIALKNSRETNYGTYIAIQNELMAAYAFLRNREAKRLYGMTYPDILQGLKDAKKDSDEEKQFQEKKDAIKKLFPEKLSEAEAEE